MSVRKAGRRTRTVRVDLARGQSAAVEVELEPTVQRSAAWVVGASGLAAFLATGALVGVALDRDHSASDLDSRRLHGQLSPAEGNQINSDLDARDRFRTLAIVSGVSGAALFGAALVLYLADTPAPPIVPGQRPVRTVVMSRLELTAGRSGTAYTALLSAHF